MLMNRINGRKLYLVLNKLMFSIPVVGRRPSMKLTVTNRFSSVMENLMIFVL